MIFDWRQIWGFFFAFLGGLGSKIAFDYYSGKPRVIGYVPATRRIRVASPETGEPFDVYTDLVLLQNKGKKTATDIRIVLRGQPLGHSLEPQVDHSIERRDGEGFIFKIDYLAPGQFVILTLLNSTQLGTITYREGIIECPQVGLQILPNPWVKRTFWVFALIGVATTISYIFSLIH